MKITRCLYKHNISDENYTVSIQNITFLQTNVLIYDFFYNSYVNILLFIYQYICMLGPNRDICLYKCILARILLQMRYDMETVSDLKFITTMKLICLTTYVRTSILQFVNDTYRVYSSEERFYCNRTIIKINQTPNHRKTRQHLELRPRPRLDISCIIVSPVSGYLLYRTIFCTIVSPVP
jgi:alpha-N-acetylglucosamine transferase